MILKFDTIPDNPQDLKTFDTQVRFSYAIEEQSYLWDLHPDIKNILIKADWSDFDRHVLLKHLMI